METYTPKQLSDQIIIWKSELTKLKHDQVCDIDAGFLTRLNRFIRIKCLRYLINSYGLGTIRKHPESLKAPRVNTPT